MGFVLGSFLFTLAFKEFRPRGGSAPFIRFILKNSCYDWSFIIFGLSLESLFKTCGRRFKCYFWVSWALVGIGIIFFKMGYSLGITQPLASQTLGIGFPVLMLGLLTLLFLDPQIEGQNRGKILFYSLQGPGSMHAPIEISLLAGLFIGVLAQRSRFCTMGAFRDLILFRQLHLLLGVISLFLTAFIVNFLLGQFKFGFENQPIAHTMQVWNFLGMVLAGLAFALAGGCPGSQLILSGEGDMDAAIFVSGMIVGAALSHNFGLASSAKGVGLTDQKLV
ncbi:MAG: YedE family putative selenium transporter [Thermodesulfobacteriaceae bacterium]|nr:YedE family putative selenium transporter [Thermodesulfobacteriaceae bacterium]MDW8136637.1 YedE family putative selenium transporter [Thermodesulfobacterium sp.]